LAATNTRKQSTVTFEVFVLWLCNQCCYTRDLIGLKMTYKDLPYHEDIMAKTRCEYKLYENKHENHASRSHIFRKWSITWSQFVLSGHTKRWLICHSMASTAIFSSCDSKIIIMVGRVWIAEV